MAAPIQSPDIAVALMAREARVPIAAADINTPLIISAYQRAITAENHPLEAIAVSGTPSIEDIRAFGDAAIGSQFDAAGNRQYVAGPEQNRRNRLDTVGVYVTDIINGRNINVLADNPDVQGWLEAIIEQNADRATQYRAISNAERKNLRIALLNSKQTKELASNLLKETIGPNKIVTDKSEEHGKKAENLQAQRKQLDADRQEKEKNIKQLRDDRDRIQQETEKSIKELQAELAGDKKTKESDIKTASDEEREYTTYDSGGAATKGRFVAQLEGLQTEAGPLRGEVALLTKEISEVGNRITSLEKAVADISITITPALPDVARIKERRDLLLEDIERLTKTSESKKTELGIKQKTLSEKEVTIKSIQERKTVLENKRAKLEVDYKTKEADIATKISELEKGNREKRTASNTEIAQLEKERQEIVKQLADVDKNLAEALNNFHAERLKRTTAEAQIVSQLETILPTAIAGALNEEIGALVKADGEVEEKKAADAKSVMEAGIRRNMGNYLRLTNNEVNWEHAQNAWNLFLGGGVDAVLSIGPPPILTNQNGTPVTLAELKSNKELYDTLSTDIKNRMRRIRAAMPRGVGQWWGEAATFARGPQPLTSGEAVGIINQLGEPFLQELVATDQSIRNALKSVGEQGMLTAGTNISENLKKRSLGELLFLLPMLLAGGLFGKGRP